MLPGILAHVLVGEADYVPYAEQMVTQLTWELSSHQPALPEAVVAAACNDHMVDYVDLEDAARVDHSVGELNVLRTRLGAPGRVIVGDNHGTRSCGHCGSEHFARLNRNVRYRTYGYQLDSDQSVSGVE